MAAAIIKKDKTRKPITPVVGFLFSQPLHPSQKIIKTNKKGITTQMKVYVTQELVMIKFVALLKRTSVGKDIGSVANVYYMHVENLRELIYDLENLRGDTSIDQIMTDLNNI